MPVVVLRLDLDEVAVLADCVALAIDRNDGSDSEDLALLLKQLRARTRNSRHTAQ